MGSALWCCLHITLERSKVLLTKMVMLTVRVSKPLRCVYMGRMDLEPILPVKLAVSTTDRTAFDPF